MDTITVECTIRRPATKEIPTGGSDVELRRTIRFRPVDPTRLDSPHVAEVTPDEADVLFNADAKVYRLYRAPAGAAAAPLSAPASTKSAEAATNFAAATSSAAGTDAGTTAAPAGTDTTGSSAPADTTPPATKPGDSDGNGVITARELRELIDSKQASPDYLRDLIEAEKQAAKPRNSIIEIAERGIRVLTGEAG